MVLKATEMSPIYIPTVREEWIKAAQQKPPPILEDPENLPRQPNKPIDPKPVRKHVAKKSGVRQQKSDNKDDDNKNKSQQQTEDPGDQPGDLTGEPDPQPPSIDNKGS